jgi:rhodanese-related sulfurtransferase
MSAAQIGPAELAHGANDGSLVVLDVRESDEYAAGHVAGSIWIPMSEIALRAGELPQDMTIGVVCRTGARSGVVADAFVAAGLSAVNLTGGLHAWVGAGLALEPADGFVL